jgi:4-aminobutyrate aminotransferase-like enzyme
MGLGTKILSGLNGSYGTYLEGWGGGVIKAPYPYSERIPMSGDQYTEYCLWYLDNHIPSCIAGRDNIAGILVEPGLAEGGNWIPSTRFLTGIRDICDKNDWLMISDEVLTGLGRTGRMWGIEHYDSDEVLTGLGRTGRMWGIEHYDVVPDILVYGKNLSGGIAPLCGISARDDIMGDNSEFTSGSTFAGTPAGCAAAIYRGRSHARMGNVQHCAPGTR